MCGIVTGYHSLRRCEQDDEKSPRMKICGCDVARNEIYLTYSKGPRKNGKYIYIYIK
jgi:hypothetical protein